MPLRRWFLVALLAAASAAAVAPAHEDEQELPAGPIRERHELMERVGDNAKIIGDAMKAGDFQKVPGPALEIEKAARRLPDLFPENSTHPKSRARPEIWSDWDGFTAAVRKLESAAANLAAAARNGTDVPNAANGLFAACKSCHTSYRAPEK